MTAKQPFEHSVESDFLARTPELCKPESPVYTQETARQDCSLFLRYLCGIAEPRKTFRKIHIPLNGTKTTGNCR